MIEGILRGIMDYVLAIVALVVGGAALVLIQRVRKEVRQLSSGVDSAIQTASRSRVASDAAAATLSRDQDELWRMRSDVDSARREVEGLRPELDAIRGEIDGVRGDIQGVHREFAEVRKDIAAVRRVLIGLRDDLDDVRTAMESMQAAGSPSPLPIPTPSHSDTLEMLRNQLRAEQQVADSDDDER
jgi:chromosome segregation ATPase